MTPTDIAWCRAETIGFGLLATLRHEAATAQMPSGTADLPQIEIVVAAISEESHRLTDYALWR